MVRRAISLLHAFLAHAWLGELGAAFDALEQAYDVGLVHAWVVESYGASIGPEVEDHPRFRAVMDAIKRRNADLRAYARMREGLEV